MLVGPPDCSLSKAGGATAGLRPVLDVTRQQPANVWVLGRLMAIVKRKASSGASGWNEHLRSCWCWRFPCRHPCQLAEPSGYRGPLLSAASSRATTGDAQKIGAPLTLARTLHFPCAGKKKQSHAEHGFSPLSECCSFVCARRQWDADVCRHGCVCVCLHRLAHACTRRLLSG
jgi:hypothetical protein